MKKLIALLPLVAVLGACSSVKPQEVEAEHDYACENGSIIRVASTTHGADRVKLSAINVAGTPSAVLQRAPSNATVGDRFENNAGFFGQATEWVVTNDEAVLNYVNNGNKIQTKCKIQ